MEYSPENPQGILVLCTSASWVYHDKCMVIWLGITNWRLCGRKHPSSIWSYCPRIWNIISLDKILLLPSLTPFYATRRQYVKIMLASLWFQAKAETLFHSVQIDSYHPNCLLSHRAPFPQGKATLEWVWPSPPSNICFKKACTSSSTPQSLYSGSHN
jgi:hypothetical protein